MYNISWKSTRMNFSRQYGTVKAKVKSQLSQKPAPLKIPRTHIFRTKYLIDKYFDNPKKLPSFIYDYTNELQLVKPYYVNIKTNLSMKAKKMTVHEFLMATSRLTIPNSIKSQFITKHLESGNVLIDGKVIPGNKIMTNNSSISSKRHRHEIPIPKFDITALKPITKSQTINIIDKPAGLPCISNMIDYAYNSLPFMLYMHNIEDRVLYLHNDIGFSSGIVVFSMNYQKAVKLLTLSQAGRIKYTYYIRVYGRIDQLITNIRIGSKSFEQANSASVEILGYDFNNDTSLLKINCYQHSLCDLKKSLSDLSHPIVNDWQHLHLHDAYITNSLNVGIGQRYDDLFHTKKLVQDAKEAGGYIMRNCIEQQKRDYVIKPQHLKLSIDLTKCYNEYKSVIHQQEHFASCAECYVTRLPYPASMMYPQIHLQSIEQEGLCLESNQKIQWL